MQLLATLANSYLLMITATNIVFSFRKVFRVWDIEGALTMGGWLAAIVCLSQVSNAAFRGQSWVAFAIEQSYVTALILLACSVMAFFM